MEHLLADAMPLSNGPFSHEPFNDKIFSIGLFNIDPIKNLPREERSFHLWLNAGMINII